MADQSLLTRTLKVGSYGKDVDAAKRTVYRGLDKLDGGKRLKAHASVKKGETSMTALARRRTFGVFFRKDVNRLNKEFGLKEDGKFDKDLLHYAGVRDYPDSLAISLFNQYADEHKPPPPPPKLVEPNQGFDSLVKDLWPLYSLGRQMGLSDLGTYNPRSYLPTSHRPSDHATSRKDGRIGQPCCAFDLGFAPATGQGNPKARAFYATAKLRPEVEYVILGNKIWSRDRGEHGYHYGGHEGHVHVSGHRR